MDDAGIWATIAKGFFLGILPALVLITGLWKLLSTRRFVARAYPATGTVIAIESEVPGTTGSPEEEVGKFGRPAFRPTFRYTDQSGRERTASTVRATVAFNFEKGSEVEILIDGDDESIADIPGATIYMPAILVTALGLCLSLGGLYAHGVL